MNSTTTVCENCNHRIKRVYEWEGKTLGIECWKAIALPVIVARKAREYELRQEGWFQRDQALAETLRAKDYSKIRSEFKLRFMHDLVEQFDEKGFITQRQKEMVYGTGNWTGTHYDHGMLNDTDSIHEAVFLYLFGNDENKITAVNVASGMEDKARLYFNEVTGADIH